MLAGDKCYPLTLIDAYSRYLLRCEAVVDPDGHRVQRIFDSTFREFGLPTAIRSDNGPPFASTGAGGLTALAVWWLRLGIRLERIEPGKPQHNGRQERFHLTLKLDVPPQRDLRAQQRAFDLYRVEYNEERPHEALAPLVPAADDARRCPGVLSQRSRRPQRLDSPAAPNDPHFARPRLRERRALPARRPPRPRPHPPRPRRRRGSIAKLSLDQED